MEKTFFSNYIQDLSAQFSAIDSSTLSSIAKVISSAQKANNKIIIAMLNDVVYGLTF
jgi:ABC-type transporter Mla MlaB component